MKRFVSLFRFIIVLILGIFIFAGGGHLARAQFLFMQNPLVGQSAPDFTLKIADGNKVNMTKLRDNQSAIIFFWATWCPHCAEAIKELNGNLKQFESKGIKLMLVDLGETEREVKAYMARNKLGATVFLDEDTSLAENYGIIGVPTLVFVDPKGVVKAVEHSLPDDYEKILEVKNSTPPKENLPEVH